MRLSQNSGSPGYSHIPRCSPRTGGMVEELLNERAARRVRRRVVHLFTAVAPLQCIAGATSPRGFFESQRGAAGGPLARTPVRLKPCRQKRAFPGFLDVSYGSYEPKGKLGNDLFRPLRGHRPGACRPVLAEKCPPDIFPGARTPKGEGLTRKGFPFPIPSSPPRPAFHTVPVPGGRPRRTAPRRFRGRCGAGRRSASRRRGTPRSPASGPSSRA